ncbi:MAG TPA: zinc-ribbon domain-containing protein, partial [Candidatus Methanoperedens sp.]
YRNIDKTTDLVTGKLVEVTEKLEKCPNCGELNPAAIKFCPKCGAATVHKEEIPAAAKCSNCGAKNSIKDIFCSNCGNPL